MSNVRPPPDPLLIGVAICCGVLFITVVVIVVLQYSGNKDTTTDDKVGEPVLSGLVNVLPGSDSDNFRPASKVGTRIVDFVKFVPQNCMQYGEFAVWDAVDNTGKTDKGGGCWVCPPGFRRTLESIVSNTSQPNPRGCFKSTGVLTAEYKPATWKRLGRGPAGIEYAPSDPHAKKFSDGYYSCPSGSSWTDGIGEKTCKKSTECNDLFTSNSFGLPCKNLADCQELATNNSLGLYDCFECPVGYMYNVPPLISPTDPKACKKL